MKEPLTRARVAATAAWCLPPVNAAAMVRRPGRARRQESGSYVVDDIFSEVDEEFRAERRRARIRRLAVFGLGLLVVVGLGVGGWQYLLYRQAGLAGAVAQAYFAAQKDADTAPPPAAGPDAPLTPEQKRSIDAFAGIAAHGPEGFATLSRLRMAALAWEGKDHDRALALWDQISRDGAADHDLRGLADLLWVQHRADDADPSLLKTRLRDILSPRSPWHLLALETDALIDLRSNRVADAKRKLTALSQDGAASESQRAEASGLLDTLDTSKTGG